MGIDELQEAPKSPIDSIIEELRSSTENLFKAKDEVVEAVHSSLRKTEEVEMLEPAKPLERVTEGNSDVYLALQEINEKLRKVNRQLYNIAKDIEL